MSEYRKPPRNAQSGFTYVMVLAAVAVIGIVVEVAHLSTWRILQAEREAELLFRGEAFVRGIESYYQADEEVKAFPRSLEDLLQDPRFPNERHMRALYPDPMVRDGDGEWTLVRAADGGVSGVASRGRGEPLKQANFKEAFKSFAGAASYGDWVFEYRPPPVKAAPGPASAAPRRF